MHRHHYKEVAEDANRTFRRMSLMRAWSARPSGPAPRCALSKTSSPLTIEQSEIGGTVAKYPRQKLVLTSPVRFPIYGNFKKLELSKEDPGLLGWGRCRAISKVNSSEKVEDIRKGEDDIRHRDGDNTARTVVLALSAAAHRKTKYGKNCRR
jgi:hypothetical protein